MQNTSKTLLSSQQIVVRIPIQEKMYLENIAQKQNTTLSEITRQALKKFIYPKNTTQNHLLMLGEIGHSQSDTKKPKSLSTTYKKHLYKKK